MDITATFWYKSPIASSHYALLLLLGTFNVKIIHRKRGIIGQAEIPIYIIDRRDPDLSYFHLEKFYDLEKVAHDMAACWWEKVVSGDASPIWNIQIRKFDEYYEFDEVCVAIACQAQVAVCGVAARALSPDEFVVEVVHRSTHANREFVERAFDSENIGAQRWLVTQAFSQFKECGYC